MRCSLCRNTAPEVPAEQQEHHSAGSGKEWQAGAGRSRDGQGAAGGIGEACHAWKNVMRRKPSASHWVQKLPVDLYKP